MPEMSGVRTSAGGNSAEIDIRNQSSDSNSAHETAKSQKNTETSPTQHIPTKAVESPQQVIRDTISVTDTISRTIFILDTIFISGHAMNNDHEIPMRVIKEKSNVKWTILLNAGYGGCFLGGAAVSFTIEKWGMQLSAAGSFRADNGTYNCTSSGAIEGGGYFWGNGSSCISTWHALCGPVWNVSKMLSIFAGAGFGCRTVNWQDIDGSWATVTDISRSGIAANAGVMLHFNRLTLSASCVYNGNFAPMIGAGISF